jgi:hypothetical protein
MTTATSVLESLPEALRPSADELVEIGSGVRILERLDEYADDYDVRTLAYGVLYSDSTGRTFGTLSMALRRTTAWSVAALLAAMQTAGVERVCDVPRWLNENAMRVLSEVA